MPKANNERNLITEEVRKAQSRFNRIATKAVLKSQDRVLFNALTTWLHAELAAQIEIDEAGPEASPEPTNG